MTKNKWIRRYPGNGPCRIGMAGMVLTVLLLALPFPAAAHSPAEVLISYDAAKRTLEVQITHNSSTPRTHYVQKVEIKKNGKSLTVAEYTSQPDQTTFTYTYPIVADSGDLIEATAACSVFGSRTGTLDLRKTLR
jgi:hypothetical protein